MSQLSHKTGSISDSMADTKEVLLQGKGFLKDGGAIEMSNNSKHSLIAKPILIVAILGITFLCSCGQKATKPSKALIAQLCAQYGAIQDWCKAFDEEGIILPNGHRDAYTIDVGKCGIKG